MAYRLPGNYPVLRVIDGDTIVTEIDGKEESLRLKSCRKWLQKTFGTTNHAPLTPAATATAPTATAPPNANANHQTQHLAAQVKSLSLSPSPLSTRLQIHSEKKEAERHEKSKAG